MVIHKRAPFPSSRTAFRTAVIIPQWLQHRPSCAVYFISCLRFPTYTTPFMHPLPPASSTGGLLNLANGWPSLRAFATNSTTSMATSVFISQCPSKPITNTTRKPTYSTGDWEFTIPHDTGTYSHKSESQNKYISSYSERIQPTYKLVGVYTWHGRVHLLTTGGELNMDGSN